MSRSTEQCAPGKSAALPIVVLLERLLTQTIRGKLDNHGSVPSLVLHWR